MSSNYHTPIIQSPRQAANANTFNAPLAELDEALTAQASAISTLQSDVSAAQGNISTLQGEMDTAQGAISTLQGEMDTAQGAISTLQSDVSAAQGDISTLQTDMGAAQGAISTLQGEMDTAQGAIFTLQSDVSTAQGAISTLQTDMGAVQEFQSMSGNACCGRLTLANGEPIPSSPQSDKSMLYFAPYQGDTIMVYDLALGVFVPVRFSDMSLYLNPVTVESGHVYDVFLFKDGTNVRIGFARGTSWATVNSRGTGAGTCELQYKQGVLVNKYSIDLEYSYPFGGFNVTSKTIQPFEGLWIGSFYATDDGETSDDETRRCLYNAFNRVGTRGVAYTEDEHAYTSATQRNWGGDLSTSVQVLMGIERQLAHVYFSAQWEGGQKVGLQVADEAPIEQLTQNYTESTLVLGASKEVQLRLGLNTIVGRELGDGSTGYFYDFRTEVSAEM